MTSPWLYFGGGIVLGALGGALGMHIYNQKTQKDVIAAQVAVEVEDELTKTKSFFEKSLKYKAAREFEEVADKVEFEEEMEIGKYSEIVESEGYSEVEMPTFEDSEIDKDTPYVITKLMYESDEEYSKAVLLYYENDETLVDEDGDPIENIFQAIGHSVVNFGRFSEDPDTVYVRNDTIDMDFEVRRIEQSWVDSVVEKLGSDD